LEENKTAAEKNLFLSVYSLYAMDEATIMKAPNNPDEKVWK
jgi:hypothetical protein